MESYRIEKREAMKIALTDKDGLVEPIPASGASHVTDPELERLSNILATFNEPARPPAGTPRQTSRRVVATAT